MKPEEQIVSEINKAMLRHGYRMVSAESSPHVDSTELRFVVAGDKVLAERLRPVVVRVSGLDVLCCSNPRDLARRKVHDAMAEVDGKR